MPQMIHATYAQLISCVTTEHDAGFLSLPFKSLSDCLKISIQMSHEIVMLEVKQKGIHRQAAVAHEVSECQLERTSAALGDDRPRSTIRLSQPQETFAYVCSTILTISVIDLGFGGDEVVIEIQVQDTVHYPTHYYRYHTICILPLPLGRESRIINCFTLVARTFSRFRTALSKLFLALWGA
ncbi:hypothetical protein EDD18DRAFT_1353379 [Armillaria luteobubalina]|uniref:Uncharacterized protein n=1 Tax=Armillaria luteobubalina TaxID=153913 RepID=A0AA39Q6C1_9AGAR|nr:hypothetical protein EDD18DRAFT_1353379 [Armillaria luteobubalina]